ncbi:MAG: ATP synthase F0 subunit B [Syntrophales bacterium]|nr:ATP synthase F0 subunit B [Syntrophales bacterium]
MMGIRPHNNVWVCCLSLLFLLLLVVSVYAAGGEHGGDKKAEWIDFGWRLLNFAVLVGFLYWLSAKKIKEFFVTRKDDIKIALDRAESARKEAEEKYKEYTVRLAKATDEIAGLVKMIEEQGLAEKEKIIEDAKVAALKIEEDTKARMEQEFKTATIELRKEAVKLSVQMAEEILRREITQKDHEALVREYLDKVVVKN